MPSRFQNARQATGIGGPLERAGEANRKLIEIFLHSTGSIEFQRYSFKVNTGAHNKATCVCVCVLANLANPSSSYIEEASYLSGAHEQPLAAILLLERLGAFELPVNLAPRNLAG